MYRTFAPPLKRSAPPLKIFAGAYVSLKMVAEGKHCKCLHYSLQTIELVAFFEGVGEFFFDGLLMFGILVVLCAYDGSFGPIFFTFK